MRPDALREIDRGETRPAAHVENLMAASEAGALPGSDGLCEPELMLQSQPFQLGPIGAEHIFFFAWFHGRAWPLSETRWKCNQSSAVPLGVPRSRGGKAAVSASPNRLKAELQALPTLKGPD